MVEHWGQTTHREEKVPKECDRIRFSMPQGKLADEIERRAVHRLTAKFIQGSVILDLASGLGGFASLALEAGHSVLAADISAPMFADANRRPSKSREFRGLYCAGPNRSNQAALKEVLPCRNGCPDTFGRKPGYPNPFDAHRAQQQVAATKSYPRNHQ